MRRDSCKTDTATFKTGPALSGDRLQWAIPVFCQLLYIMGPVLNPENYMIASPLLHFICCEIIFFIESNMWNTMLVNKAFYQSMAGVLGEALWKECKSLSGICGYLHDLPKGKRPDPSAVPWPVGLLPVTDKRTTHIDALRARGPAQPWPHPLPPPYPT